jgi:hypothetical protein
VISQHGLDMYRDNQQNGLPRSFEGSFAMDFNLWSRVGYDNRSDSVWRRGIVDISYYADGLPNGGNPTSTVQGLRAAEPTVALHDLAVDPQFKGFSSNGYANSIISQSQDATITSYLANDVDWTAFALLQATSPAVDRMSATLPPKMASVMSRWGLTPEVTGSGLDLGPLESGIAWSANMKGPEI